MQSFQFKVLGANSAFPTPDRFSSCFVVTYGGRHIMIDCGEGAQIKMVQHGVKPSKLEAILISHLHGDHLFGLPGLLNSLALNGRNAPLHVYGPKGIKEYIETVRRLSGSYEVYDLIIHEKESDDTEVIAEHLGLTITAFALKHRIPTYGYLIQEPDSADNIDPKAISKYELTVEEILAAKSGKSIKRDQQEITPQDVLLPVREGRSIAYCSDTIYKPDIIPVIEKATLLYHEATYMHDRQEKAEQHMHSTTIEAATIARDAGVGQLVIGHYSSRYDDLEPYVEEAQTVFEDSAVAVEGAVFELE